MTLKFDRDMGNGNVEPLGVMRVEDNAAARAVALALATHGGGIVTGRDTDGLVIVSAQGRADGSWVESRPQEKPQERTCARCGDELGRYDFPSNVLDGRICHACAARE